MILHVTFKINCRSYSSVFLDRVAICDYAALFQSDCSCFFNFLFVMSFNE